MRDSKKDTRSGTFVSITSGKTYKFSSLDDLESMFVLLDEGKHTGDILFDNSNTSFTFSFMEKSIVMGLLDYMRQYKDFDIDEEIEKEKDNVK